METTHTVNEKEYKIRPLVRKDRKVLTSLIAKLSEKMQDTQILEIIKSNYDPKQNKETKPETENENQFLYVQIAIQVFGRLIELLNDDVSEWFCDLLGIKLEEYDECPFSIEASVMQQIIESKGFSDFFGFASGISKSIGKFQRGMKNGKAK